MLDPDVRNAYENCFTDTRATAAVLADLGGFVRRLPDPLRLGAHDLLEHLRGRIGETHRPSRGIEPSRLD
jgi:hypothetical protein